MMTQRLLITCLLLVVYSGQISAQASTDIYLFDIERKDGKIILSNGKNITRHKGYDNQPYFHPTESKIYYASFNDSGRSDIKVYDYVTGQTSQFTQTKEREYSPTITPDGKYVSCILQRDNGAQDLVRYPISGGKPEVLIWHLKVGYHVWAEEKRVFLFVLDDSIHHSLHNYYLGSNMDTVVAENIGRCLLNIPGQAAISFVQKIPGKTPVIKRFDLLTSVISTINNGIEGQEDLTWLNDRVMLMSDGKRFFSCTDLHLASWMPVTVLGDTRMLKSVSRLAVSPDNRKLAVVVAE